MTYLGIEVNETALLILLAIIAVSLIFIGWKLATPATPATPTTTWRPGSPWCRWCSKPAVSTSPRP